MNLHQKRCYWSGGAEPARGMRISCVKGGAGWESLSSVRHAGEMPKRAPKWSKYVQLHSKMRQDGILLWVKELTSSEMSVKVLVCARVQHTFHEKVVFISLDRIRSKSTRKWHLRTFLQFPSRNATTSALKVQSDCDLGGKCINRIRKVYENVAHVVKSWSVIQKLKNPKPLR